MATDPSGNETGTPLSELRRSLLENAIDVTENLALLPESQRSRMFLGIQTAVIAGRRRRRRRVLVSFATASVLLAVGITASLRPARVPTGGDVTSVVASQWEEIDLGANGHLSVRVGSDYVLPAFPPACEKDATRVALHSGALCAQINHREAALADPLLIATPDFVVEVVGTQFCVEAWRGVSVVDVEEGAVRVQAGDSPRVRVGAGESLRSDDAQLGAPATGVAIAPVPSPTAALARVPIQKAAVDCAALREVGERRHCYAVRSLGSGVSAANALYSLALIDGEQLVDHRAAIAELLGYQARFPAGILSPEVSAMLMRELATVDRAADAVSEAERFRRRFPDHPRAEDVALVEGNLLLNRLGRTVDAAGVYRSLLGRPLTVAQRRSLDAALRALPPSISQPSEVPQ